MAATMTPTDAQQRAAAGRLTIVDIRRPEEMAATGVPAGALAVPLQDATLALREGFVQELLAVLGGDYDRPLAVICASGVRSAFAQQLLARAGFAAVHDIGEGMLGSNHGPGWLARALPLAPYQPPTPAPAR